MKLKEETIKELNELPPQHLSKVYDFIQIIKKQNQNMAVHARQARKPYLRSRKILAKCRGSLTDDVIKGREERL